MADENEPKDDVSEEDVEKDQQQQNPIRLDRRTILVRTLGVDIASVIFNHWTNENTRNCFNALCNIPGGTKVLKRIALMVPSLGNPTNISAQRSKVGGQPLKTFRASLEQAPTEQPRQVIEKANNRKAHFRLYPQLYPTFQPACPPGQAGAALGICSR